jgi:hypothetical protein
MVRVMVRIECSIGNRGSAVSVKDQFIRQGSRLCADIAAATRPVVDNKLLADPGDEGGGRQ